MTKLIIGLGNPGIEYSNTRHNVGFNFVNFFVSKNRLGNFKYEKKFNAEILISNSNRNKIIFLKPMTFMNLSGYSVSKVVNFFKIELNEILIIYDDTSFSVGEYKLKTKGSSGGHNGVKDIAKALSTNEIKRLKIGINNEFNKNTKDFVLKQFSPNDLEILDIVFIKLNSLVDDYVYKDLSFEKLLSKYN